VAAPNLVSQNPLYPFVYRPPSIIASASAVRATEWWGP